MADHPSLTGSRLIDLPTEVLQQVALHLPAYSVAALCCTCMTAQNKLTIRANLLWWKLVPESVSREKARFQKVVAGFPRGSMRQDHYDSRIEYKREILGRIRCHPVRCTGCLQRLHAPYHWSKSIDIPPGCPQEIYNKGSWCESCVREAISDMEPGTIHWFQQRCRDPSGQVLMLYPPCSSLLISSNEYQQLRVRLKIITCAKLYWEGINPVHLLAKPNPSSVTHKFREKWAPTQKLQSFLFHPALLELDKPERNARSYHPDGHGYLSDPTRNQRTWQDYVDASTRNSLAFNAHKMLKALIDFSNPRYFDPASQLGGTCIPWIAAAKDWHRKALREEVINGNALRMIHITQVSLQGPMRAIRCRLGLPTTPSASEILKPEIIERASNFLVNSCSWAIRGDRHLIVFAVHRPTGLEGYLNYCLRHDPMRFFMGEIHWVG